MMEQIFMQVLDMSRVASFIIILVIIVRTFLKRFPKFVSYMLWSVVLFRLLCPFSFESMVSLIPEMKPTSYYYSLLDETISVKNDGEDKQQITKEVLKDNVTDSDIESTDIENDSNINISVFLEIVISFGQYVWLTGMCAMFMYYIISYQKVCRKVSTAIPLRDNVYIVDNEISPFVKGIFQPKIYLPDHLAKNEQEYIILHEQFHIRRLDHIVKVLAFIALSIHWFNPLVWLAFILASKDMEMSCDEAVIKRKGETIKAEYSSSLLSLTVGRRIIPGTSLAFGEGNVKDRIKNLAIWEMPDKKHLSIVVIGVVVFTICLMANPTSTVFPAIIDDKETENPSMQVEIDIEEHYITATGDPCNVYFVDENKVLWGRGENNLGQLGQGTKDLDYHHENVKIAENVIHVDYSQKGFMIYLTEDNKLYGCGNSGTGALQQYDTFDWDRYFNMDLERYYVDTPCLLMEDVRYARCGQDDIVCLTNDGSVWIWGTICVDGGYLSSDVSYIAKPKKVLEDAVLVTGGWFNHAALLQDGTLWTWGYNLTGNCGVKDKRVVGEPTQVAEDVVMVWTGTMQYNIDCFDTISQYEGEYPRQYENTIIKKTDGSYLICGIDVGSEPKHIEPYYELVEIDLICSDEFIPIQNSNFEISIINE